MCFLSRQQIQHQADAEGLRDPGCSQAAEQQCSDTVVLTCTYWFCQHLLVWRNNFTCFKALRKYNFNTKCSIKSLCESIFLQSCLYALYLGGADYTAVYYRHIHEISFTINHFFCLYCFNSNSTPTNTCLISFCPLYRKYHKNIFTQYVPRELSDEEKENILQSESLKNFCNSVTPR